MPDLSSGLLSTILALSATILAISVATQIVQEIYKYVTKSKFRSYSKALVDFLGPWATQLLRPEIIAEWGVRGPFQLRRLRPQGLLLPLGPEELVSSLERTAPYWIRRAANALRFEEKTQKGHTQKPSGNWLTFLDELGKAERGSLGYWNALEVTGFLRKWQFGQGTEVPQSGSEVGPITIPEQIDASAMLLAFRQRFLSHVEKAEKHFSQLEQNFDYLYQRRNLRQTFTIGFVLAALFNFPFDRLYLASSRLSPDESIQVAEHAIEVYNQQKELQNQTDSTLLHQLQQARLVLKQSLKEKPLKTDSLKQSGLDYLAGWTVIKQCGVSKVWCIIRYFFGCLITALLVSFGAPFWNDLASSLLQFQKSRRRIPQPVEKEQG